MYGELPHPQKRKKKRVKRVILACMLLILLIAGEKFYMLINEPAQGTVLKSSSTQVLVTPQTATTLVGVQGKSIHFSYPSFFTPNAALQPAKAPILESFQYRRLNTLDAWILSISVTSLAGDNLSYDSGYYSRTQNPTQYLQSTSHEGANTFTVFTDKQADGFGQVAYSLNNSRSVSVSLIGNDYGGTQSLQTAFNQVLASFTWK